MRPFYLYALIAPLLAVFVMAASPSFAVMRDPLLKPAIEWAPAPDFLSLPESAAKVPKPQRRPVKATSEEDALPSPDTDEALPLPPYPPHTRKVTGKMQSYRMGEEDTLLDVARHYRLGFIELRAANPDVDPWTAVPGEEVVIPSFKLLPRTEQKGIVVNLAQMRMYYFKDPKKEPVTFPIGIGREGLQTPTGVTSVINKVAGPIWFPTDRMREEKPYLPAAVPAGPSNPLGTHALYLGWPTFLIHGSNKPWAIGRRVSSGCMRMYPEDIIDLFKMVPVGTKVTVVDQPILVAWVGDKLYLEANPSKSQGNDIEIDGEHAVKDFSDAVKKVIVDAAGIKPEMINWEVVKKTLAERKGYPVQIADKNISPPPPPPEKKRTRVEHRYNYN
jgi:L,D-transpeptidase ErfK/SrfK